MGRMTKCAGVAALALTLGCTAAQVLDEEELARVQALDQKIEQLEQEQKTTEFTAIAALNQAKNAALRGDKAEAERIIAAVDQYDAEWNAQAEALRQALNERQEIIDGAVQGKTEAATGFLSGVIGSVFPPAAPFLKYLDFLAVPLVGLFFPRGRQRLKVAAKNLAKGRIFDLVKEVTKVFGWTHSNDEPTEVLKGASAAARSKRDLETAKKIDDFRASLT